MVCLRVSADTPVVAMKRDSWTYNWAVSFVARLSNRRQTDGYGLDIGTLAIKGRGNAALPLFHAGTQGVE